MLKHLSKKGFIAILTILGIITISFLMVRFMPGDPLMHLVGEENYHEMKRENPAQLELIAKRYGLNDSLGQQYINYLKNIISLDFGTAYSNNKPVLENVLYRAGWTLKLSVPTFVLGGFAGLILGTIAGWKPGSTLDKVITSLSLFLNTVPSNCIGILFLVLFAFKLGWFPLNGMTSGGLQGFQKTIDVIWHAALPFSLLFLFRTAGDTLLMKSNVSQVRNEEYTITAFSKGLSDNKVLFRHVLKNAMLPFVTSLCMQLGGLLSGSMIIEVIFGWKGMGELFYNAVNSRDFPTAQLCFVISAVCIVAGNLLGDFLIAIIDPRIKEGSVEY